MILIENLDISAKKATAKNIFHEKIVVAKKPEVEEMEDIDDDNDNFDKFINSIKAKTSRKYTFDDSSGDEVEKKKKISCLILRSLHCKSRGVTPLKTNNGIL